MYTFESKWGSVVNLTLKQRNYTNGRLALEAYEDGEPFAAMSVNVPDESLDPDEMAIKDYGENEGVLDFLIRNKIVSEPVRYVYSGFVRIPICKFLGFIKG